MSQQTGQHQTRESAMKLGSDIKATLDGMFRMSIDNPDALAISGDVEVYEDTRGVKYRSPFGLRFRITMQSSDLPRASRTQQAADAWLVTIRGKNRIPIVIEMVAE